MTSIKYPLADLDGSLVWAQDLAASDERPTALRCVGCDEPVLLRSGTRNQPHFAHRATGDCSATETALHRAAIRVLAEGVVVAARGQKQFPFPVSCSFCDAFRSGDLARDPGSTADLDRALSNDIRPDILIRGSDGEPRLIIEVVVTHAPEQNALDEYHALDLPVIVVYPTWSALESMRTGLDELAQLQTFAGSSRVELVSRCYFPRHIESDEGMVRACATCSALARLVTLEVAEGPCWSKTCSKHIRVLDVNARYGDERVLIAAGAEELKGTFEVAKTLGVRLRFRTSKRAGASYFFNVCECGAPTGDNFAYGGFGDEQYEPSTHDPVKRYIVCAQGHWELLSTRAWAPGVTLQRTGSAVGLIGDASGLFDENNVASVDEDEFFQFTRVDPADISKIARRITFGR